MATTRRALAVTASLIVMSQLFVHGLSQSLSYVLEGDVIEAAPGVVDRLPVVGAVITDDWNAASASTDDHGHFRIDIPRVAGDEFLVVTIKSGDKVYRRRFGGDALRGRPLPVDLTPHAWEVRD